MGQSLLFTCTSCKYKRELLKGTGLMTAYEICFCADCQDIVSVQTRYEAEDTTEITMFGPAMANPFAEEVENRPPPPLNCCPMCRGKNITPIDLDQLPDCPKCGQELRVSVGALWE